jgi:hypothetical protein
MMAEENDRRGGGMFSRPDWTSETSMAKLTQR